jgi:hypothetical protein
MDDFKPPRFIRDDELISTLYSLARLAVRTGADPQYLAALSDVAAAYDIERDFERQLAGLLHLPVGQPMLINGKAGR